MADQSQAHQNAILPLFLLRHIGAVVALLAQKYPLGDDINSFRVRIVINAGYLRCTHTARAQPAAPTRTAACTLALLIDV